MDSINKKAELLIKEGLYERVYSEDRYSEGFPEFDPELKKYYRKVPAECSDEEFAEILKYTDHSKEKNKYSTVANLFKGIAIAVYVIGFLLGMKAYTEYTAMPMLLVWISTFVLGTSFLGLGEIIQLLYKIYRK